MEVSASLVGSCTNSYEDMTRVASLVQQAKDAGLQLKCLCIQDTLESVEAIILSNSILQQIQIKGMIQLISNSNHQQVFHCCIIFLR